MPALREAAATARINAADLPRSVFSPIARDYERPALVLSLFQYRRWHRFLLRYVSDVPTTLRGLARLLKPGGMIASLDFAIPRGVWYPLWRLYTDVALPSYGRLFSRHWRDVGAFLGPSIRGFYSRWPEERLLDAWQDA